MCAYVVCVVDKSPYYKNYVPIRVNKTTREKLKSIGSKKETYDDIINKLLKRKK